MIYIARIFLVIIANAFAAFFTGYLFRFIFRWRSVHGDPFEYVQWQFIMGLVFFAPLQFWIYRKLTDYFEVSITRFIAIASALSVGILVSILFGFAFPSLLYLLQNCVYAVSCNVIFCEFYKLKIFHK